MSKSIRIRQAAPTPSFTERIEATARQIATKQRAAPWDTAPNSTIERELAFLVDRLDGQRALHAAMQNEIGGVGRVLGQDLELRVSGRLRYVATEVERDALRDRLLRLQRDQIRLAQWHQDRIEPLHERLLTLLNRHAMLGSGSNEY